MPEILGKTFKKAREAKQLSVEEASEKTRIPKKIIKAIEEDRLCEIPSVFYARGFVRTYSKFLGCEGEKAVKEYLAGSEKKKEEPRLLLDNEQVPGDKVLKYQRKAAIALLAIFGIWMLGLGILQVKKFVSNSASKYKAHVADKKEQAVKEQAVKIVPPREAAKEKVQDAAKAVPEKTEGIELEISARASTLIEVVSDDDLLFKGILKKGSSDTWRAKKEINLEIGNAGGVTLKLNGKDLGYAGKRGKKKTIEITKDGIIDKTK